MLEYQILRIETGFYNIHTDLCYNSEFLSFFFLTLIKYNSENMVSTQFFNFLIHFKMKQIYEGKAWG